MAGRTVHACPGCQPLTQGAALSLKPARRAALAAAGAAAVFTSHCAPDDDAEAATLAPGKLTIAKLKEQLVAKGLSTAGRKAELAARLAAAAIVAAEGTMGKGMENGVEVPELATPNVKASAPGRRGKRAAAAAVKKEEKEKDDEEIETVPLVYPEMYEWDFVPGNTKELPVPGTKGMMMKSAEASDVFMHCFFLPLFFPSSFALLFFCFFFLPAGS
jgi:hypothetical protein